MKKILKFFFMSGLTVLVLMFLSFTVIAISALAPTLKKADVSFVDIVTENLDPEEYTEIKSMVKESSSELGKDAAISIINILKALFPSTASIEIETTPVPSLSPEEVLKQIDDSAAKSAKEGLEILKDIDKQNLEILKDSIENNNKD